MDKRTEIIWRDFHKALKNFIALKVNSKDDADDILQDIFIRIHNKIGTLKSELKLESWIYQITRNAIIDYYRSRKEKVELPESLTEYNSFENEAIKRISPSILKMIEELPFAYKEALTLTEYEGMKQAQLANKLGVSLSGAKSRVQRARRLLKQMLLDCCNFELDRFGNIIDYNEKNKCCKKSSMYSLDPKSKACTT